MAQRKDRMDLLKRYWGYHKEKYGQGPTLNFSAEQWTADALIESYGLDLCYDILSYYFKVNQSPSWDSFAFNAERILKAKLNKDQDNKEREERRRMAREWLNG